MVHLALRKMVKKEIYKDTFVKNVINLLPQKEEKIIQKNYLKNIFGINRL